ncbi:MAG: hypothetical protein GY772_08935, partial [bacterium]|nr:hypothetical protein [bacterium]
MKKQKLLNSRVGQKRATREFDENAQKRKNTRIRKLPKTVHWRIRRENGPRKIFWRIRVSAKNGNPRIQQFAVFLKNGVGRAFERHCHFVDQGGAL